MEDGAGAVVFAPPRFPNKLPPRPPDAAGCDVPDGALDEVPAPENRLGVVPGDGVLIAPNNDLGAPEADAPLEAG